MSGFSNGLTTRSLSTLHSAMSCRNQSKSDQIRLNPTKSNHYFFSGKRSGRMALAGDGLGLLGMPGLPVTLRHRRQKLDSPVTQGHGDRPEPIRPDSFRSPITQIPHVKKSRLIAVAPRKSSRLRDEANHGTHSVFCRENGWISLLRPAGVSGGAVYTYASPVRNEPDGVKSSSPFDGRMRDMLFVILRPASRCQLAAASERSNR